MLRRHWMIGVVSVLLAGCAENLTSGDDIHGRFAAPALDAWLTLNLLDKGVFIADWWVQEPKHGDILGGWTSGRWHRRNGEVVLRYSTKGKPGEAVFIVFKKDGRTYLKMKQESEFPFTEFFGGDWQKETEHFQTFEDAFRAARERRQKWSQPFKGK